MFSRFFSLLSAAMIVGISSVAAFEGKLHVEAYKGQEIAPYSKDIVQLSNTLFKGYPYFYNGNDGEYTEHLQSYAQSKNGIISIAFDGDKIVGVATGIPLSEAWDKYQKPFQQRGDDVKKIYYLGELLVLPEYTGKGLGQQMAKEVEKFAKEKGFQTITAQVIDEKSLKEPAPTGHYSMTNVLQKLGYQERPEINMESMWTNVNADKETSHKMVYWTKSLK